MIYIEYHEYKNKYYAAQKEYDKLLSEKEILFARTQPQATEYDKEKVSGGCPGNSFDNYLVTKEKKQLDERIEETRSILEGREKLYKQKEEELKLSENPYDKIYYNKYVKNLNPYKMWDVDYEVSQIYRILRKIEKTLNMTQKDTKTILQ